MPGTGIAGNMLGVPTETHPRDRFDDVPRQRGRIGAHRAEEPHARGFVVLMWVVIAVVVFGAAATVGFLALVQDNPLLGASVDHGAALAAAQRIITVA